MSNLSPNAIFWMYNSVYFSFIQIFHGLLVPWMLTIPWKRNKRQSPKQEFYVLKPKQLLPRRYLARKCQSESLVCCVIGQQTLHTEFNTLCSKPNPTSDQVRLFSLNTHGVGAYLISYMQKAGDTCDISPQFFLDFPQNFRLRTRNQYCTQAIA